MTRTISAPRINRRKTYFQQSAVVINKKIKIKIKIKINLDFSF
jgi:hypothetical protein